MDSAAQQTVDVPEDLLRFDHPDQWQTRPGWQPSISLTEQNIERIVGGYDLARDLYQECGLCRTKHGKGYVIATVDGLETQIGHRCGATHLGATFVEMERFFVEKRDTQDRLNRFRNLIAQRDTLGLQARQRMAECQAAKAAVAEILKQIDGSQSVSTVFRRALDADGVVDIQRTASKDEYELTRQRYRTEVLARIDAVSAVTARSPRDDIQARVLTLVYDLNEETLDGLNLKQLNAKSKEATDALALLDDAVTYVQLVKRFTSRKNWQAFAAAFGPDRHKTNGQGVRILGRLVSNATE